ncbi:hypothetical protein [Prosthecobacter sp.]|uniref:hypothetical protein n=1 Tax=Prosthecobacter sp. TaxID=1965333 RepID=UPI001DD426DD|nr:hypothetical protein [Prosthecobacter sp.]MCB1279814.1 hypothetical protein [Prosthecobacter sp.]
MLSCVVWCLLLATAYAREFTDASGRKITGEISSASPSQGTVTLIRQDGVVVTFPYKLLTASDQLYVSQWWKENRKFSFRIQSQLVRGSRVNVGAISKETSGGTATANVTEARAGYVIDIQNFSNEPTPPLVLQCVLFTKADKGAKMDRPLPYTYCEEAMPALNASAQHRFGTADMVLNGARAGSSSMFRSGNAKVMRDQAGGFFLQIWSGDRPVFVYATEKELEDFGNECILRWIARAFPGATNEVLNITKPLDLSSLPSPFNSGKAVPLISRLEGTRWQYGGKGTIEFKNGDILASWGSSGAAFTEGIQWIQWEDEDVEMEFDMALTKFTARSEGQPDVRGQRQ